MSYFSYRGLSEIVRRQKGYLEVSNPDRKGPMRIRVMKNGKCLAQGENRHLDVAAIACLEQLREAP